MSFVVIPYIIIKSLQICVHVMPCVKFRSRLFNKNLDDSETYFLLNFDNVDQVLL